MKHTNTAAVRAIQVLLSILLFLSTGILVVEVLLMGILTAFGKSIDVVSAVDLILAVGRFSSSAWYRPVAEMAMGIYYYGLVIYMVVQVISAIKSFVGCLQNAATEERYNLSIRRLLSSFGGCLAGIVAFFVSSRIVAGYGEMSDSLMHIILCGLAVHFVARLFLRYIEYRHFGLALYEGLLCNGLFMIAWLLFCYSLRDASLYSLSQGVNSLISQNTFDDMPTRHYVTLAYEVFFKNIMLISLMSGALSRLSDALTAVDHRSMGKSAIRKPMIASIVMVCICVIMSTYLANGSIADSALNIVLGYAPMILSVVTAFVAMTIPNKYPAAPSPSFETHEGETSASSGV